MAKISITLPNVTEISLDATDPSELQQLVEMVKSHLLIELAQLPPASTRNEDVPIKPDKDISVTPNGSFQSPDTQPVNDGKAPDDLPSPEEPPEAVPPPGQPPLKETPKPIPSSRGESSPPNPASSIPPQLSDPRLRHDFATFCRTVNPIAAMRRVVVAAEGAARMFSMVNVDDWELKHLFEIAGWSQPHSFTQTLRNAARTKFQWMERVSGRAGRYSVTDAGRAVVLKGTNLV